MGYVPTGVVELVLIVIVEVPEPGAGIDVGLKRDGCACWRTQ